MRASGFTMVELLIVAILLALLAGIIVPQFFSTTNEASESALKSNLEAIRSAINLYRVQHGRYPGRRASEGATCSGGVSGTGEADSPEAFVEQLVLYSKSGGRVCTLRKADRFPFGPYLESTIFPANPVTGSREIVVVVRGNPESGSLSISADSSGAGWKYDPKSGRFIANDNTLDSRGKPFDEY